MISYILSVSVKVSYLQLLYLVSGWYRPVRTDADDGVLARDDHGAVDLVIAALQLVHQLRLGHVLRGLHGGGLLLCNLGSDHIMLCTGRRMMTGLMGVFLFTFLSKL